jgi:hypothetical protein
MAISEYFSLFLISFSKKYRKLILLAALAINSLSFFSKDLRVSMAESIFFFFK